ncbi:MAG: hypothetical protein JWM94_1389 [Sphingomonas bacterium]|nr:hypothetical protein [Sphingomonas bacterium]
MVTLAPLEQVDGLLAQSHRDPRENKNRRIALPSFDATHICQINLGREGELLLRQFRFGSQTANITTNDRAPIGHGANKV